jgi:hypothetical protein
LPAINLVNIRVQKEVVIKGTQRLDLMMNLFNFFDEHTVNSVYQTTGPSFGRPAGELDGTVVRFSMRYSF